MDFLHSYCQLGYYKFLLYKYRFSMFWRNLPDVYRYGCMICMGTGASICIYQYLLKPRDPFKSEDFKETAALCERRKKGLPPGLYNEGNTCFLNCLLQAISVSPCVRNWINKIDQEQANTGKLDVVPCLNRLLKVLSNEVGNHDDYSAMGLVESLRGHGWMISHEQHDAYELFQVLVSTVNEEVECLLADYEFDDMGKRFTSSTRSIVNRISKHLPSIRNIRSDDPFKGYFANKKMCLACGEQTPIKFDAFGSIILNIPKTKLGCTLEACFAKWCKPEVLNDVTCEKCPRPKDSDTPPRQRFTKTASLCKLPKCFCIELQRTHYENDGTTLKDSRFVKFPEFLDVSPFRYQSSNLRRRETSSRPLLRGGSLKGNSLKDGKTNWYKLMSVVLHFGNAYDGHFAAYRRIPDQPDKWVYVSDQEVKLVSKKTVLGCCAYLLFYERLL